MKAIINTTVVKKDHIIPNGTVLIDGDRIAAVGKGIDVGGAEIIDAKGLFTGPGLIDIHTHAGGKAFFVDDPATASAANLDHGTTDVLPALYFSQPLEKLMEGASRIREAVNAGKAPNVIGFYMEAPYMNPKFGCNRENNPWRGPIRKEDYQPLIDLVGNDGKIWVIAPERDGIEEFVKDVKRKNPDAVFAVGHSEAEPWQIERLMKYGLRDATHHTNATGTLHKYPECRTPCVDETALYQSSIYTELICDTIGIHVDPAMLRLVRRVKGEDRIILISDAFVDFGPRPAGYEEAVDINFDFSGEISGTCLTLDRACRNMMVHTGCSVCEAFRYASTNPAALLGLSDRGSVDVGNLANLVLCDGEFNVKRVLLRGETVRAYQ